MMENYNFESNGSGRISWSHYKGERGFETNTFKKQ
jgi:hypothetical protein